MKLKYIKSDKFDHEDQMKGYLHLFVDELVGKPYLVFSPAYGEQSAIRALSNLKEELYLYKE